MPVLSRLVAFGLMSFLLCLPVLGADDKDKKAEDKKKDADKTEVKKDDPAKKDDKKADAAKKDDKKADDKKADPAKKDDKKADDKKADPAKKDDKKADNKKMPSPKMPPKKGAHKNLERDPAAAAEKMLKSTSVSGTVMAVVEDKKSLRIQLTIPYLKINEGQLNNYNTAAAAMLTAQNPQQYAQKQMDMVRAEAQIYEVATTTKEVEWSSTDDVKVRMRNPPPQFDEKGRAKRYTAKELKELRGTDKLPGYPAEFSDLKTGQIVQVTLVRKKDAPRTPRRGKDAELLGDNLPQMSHIIILVDPKP